MTQRQSPPEQELSHAGVVVDKAIEYMISQDLSEVAVASALLGGAMGLLTRALPDKVVIQILQNAIKSIEAGELRAPSDTGQSGQA
ncbi:MAG: hypothetical protein KGL20_06400 [Rhodospirillales bacterium]|nr:hypothetical protein [Rhodospirillales bacterium]MDE1882798.1 hypothetical protein [Rhodospirillales bacterium]MDE2458848.1 hypothetical protein [Rhodospirillales bacterium]